MYRIGIWRLSWKFESCKKQDHTIMNYIILLLNQFPQLYLIEIKTLIQQHWNLEISIETIRKNLHHHGFTRKKFTTIAEQRTQPVIQNMRLSFRSIQIQLDPQKLYFYAE